MEREHITDGTTDCWCEPRVEYVPPSLKFRVWAFFGALVYLLRVKLFNR